MKTVFKIIAGLIVVIVIAIAAVLITFNPNDYKKQITDAVEQQTGRTLTIKGDISLSVFPWIGFEVGKVSLSNATGFSAADFARISKLDIKIKLLPLLRREVDIDKVRLHGLFVSLETHKDGKTNWQDLIPETTDVNKQAAPADTTTTTETTGPALAGLLINGIDFVGANIQWIDDRSGMQAKISDLNLETGAIKFDDWIPVSFSAHVNNSQPKADTNIKLDTRIRVNQALDVFDVKNFTLDVDALMKSIAPERIVATVKMNADADMRKQTVNLPSLNVSALGASLKAVLTITDIDTKPLIRGTLSSNTIKPRELASKLGIQLPPSRDNWALNALSFNSGLEAGTTFAKLDKLAVKLDKSTLSGFVHVNNLTQPDISYKLALDNIDVDAYLPPPAANPAPAPATTNAAPPADVPITLPLAFLRKLALDGEFSVAALQVSKIPINDILIKTHAADGVIKVDPLSMKLLGGSFNAGLTLDARTTPVYQINARAINLAPGKVVDPLLKGLLGNQKLAVEGAAQFNAAIKTHGESLNALKQAATGVVGFNMGQTSIVGVDLDNYMKTKLADFIKRKKLTPPASLQTSYTPQQKTAFDKVLVHATLGNGKVHNDRLLLDSSRLKVKGSGVIDIMANTLDEKTYVSMDVGSDDSRLGKILKNPIGVHVHGAFAQPAIDVDYHTIGKAIAAMAEDVVKEKARAKAEAFKAEQKAKIEAQKQKLKEEEAAKKAELEQKAKDKLKDKLKGLFGR